MNQTEQRTLRLAVIGCGSRGSASATDVQSAEHTSLATVMDSNEDPARLLGDRLGVPWTTSYEEVLADHNVDAVYISTPHHIHAEQALKAASVGKHIIMEKPLAHNLKAAADIVRAAREAGVQLSVWLGYRYLPQVVKAKRTIEAGALGNFLGASLTHHLYRPTLSLQQGATRGDSDWRNRWETSGGGVLILNSIHYLDWLLYLSGLKVTEVSACYTTHQGVAEVEDTIAMWVTFENGALATVNASSYVLGIHQSLLDCRIWGTEGHLSLTPPFQFYSSRIIDGKRPERWHSLEPLPKLHTPHIEYLKRFSRAVLEGRTVEIPGEEGLRLQAGSEVDLERIIWKRDGRSGQRAADQILKMLEERVTPVVSQRTQISVQPRP